MIDKMVMEMMIKNITEKIIEQEIIFNKMDDQPAMQDIIRKRIKNLEMERNTYVRIVKAYDL